LNEKMKQQMIPEFAASRVGGESVQGVGDTRTGIVGTACGDVTVGMMDNAISQWEALPEVGSSNTCANLVGDEYMI
jgi:hypothetical protein